MITGADFSRALASAQARIEAPELLPSALCLAARDLLFVDGVSISLAEDESGTEFRVPLGASDGDALVAENLQFTAGDGPCLSAIRSGALMHAPLVHLRRRWPVLADLMLTRSKYRSSLSFPLVSGPRGGAAMNLFYNSGNGGLEADLLDAAAVGTEVAQQLFGDSSAATFSIELFRRQGRFAGLASREDVWVVIGMIIANTGMSYSDALARMRSTAFGADCTVDELAGQLLREPQRLRDLDL